MLTRKHMLGISLSPYNTHTHSLTLTNTHTHTHSLSLSLSHTHTHTHTHTSSTHTRCVLKTYYVDNAMFNYISLFNSVYTLCKYVVFADIHHQWAKGGAFEAHE